MQIVHRISISSTPEIQGELAAMGVGAAANGLVTFEVDESNPAWSAMKAWIAKRRALDFIRTKFSKKELTDARWLELVPDWHHGYPQPNEDEFGYLEATYNLANYCEHCGMGNVQKAPFQMKGEPKWGRNGIVQLNWVFDEFFVKPEVWTRVFKPHGINCRPVTDSRGVELQTVVQLVIQNEVGIVVEGLPSEKCLRCERIKYLPVQRGAFPLLVAEPSSLMAKTKENFGSGAAANKGVVVAQAISLALAAEKVQGASVRPVAELARR